MPDSLLPGGCYFYDIYPRVSNCDMSQIDTSVSEYDKVSQNATALKIGVRSRMIQVYNSVE